MSLKIFACGDYVNFKANEDFIDSDLKEIISNSDIAICNFEAPIYHENMQAIKKAGPHLYQAFESIKYLKNVGFNYVSLANNHIYDYDQKGLKATISELNKNMINYIGAGLDFNEAYKYSIFVKDGVKISLIAACENEFGCLYEEENRGGYAYIFHYKIEDNIKKLRQEVDVIVFISHAGVEDINFPIKEWRDRYKRLCDLGVDVIIGHHPHVPQGYEIYNNSIIFYSLGNFYFDTAGFEHKSDDSYSVILEFSKNGLKDFQIIKHKKINGKVYKIKDDEASFCLENLNNLLMDNYEERNNEICLKLFERYYYDYYKIAIGKLPENISFREKLKYIIKVLLGKNSDNKLLLLHNIKIDSHRFIVQRALKLITGAI